METKDIFMAKGITSWKNGRAYNITFIVTEDCNLRCKYCYQVHKNNKKRMTLDTAKMAVDYFLNNSDFFNTEAVIWDFIGGEPFLEIDLIDKIVDYIKIRSYELNHRWFNQYRISISTNGTLYHHKKARNFIKKNRTKTTIGISIDGNKVKHDLQRIHADGRGSYDEVVANVPIWLQDFPWAATKVTIGHEDLPHLKDSIIHLWNLGIRSVPANVVFEDVWEDGDDIIFENQLIELADYILENQLWDQYQCSLFDERIGHRYDKEDLYKNHCGSGKMIAVDPDGNFYPCLRYVEYSLEKNTPLIIGNINDGINIDRIRPFLGLSTLIQSDDECLDCEVATGCAWCQGANYDFSDLGTNFKRVKYICKMHKARCRANEYFWELLTREHHLKRSHYGHKRYLYFILSDDSIEHCSYLSKIGSNNRMSNQVLIRAFKFAEDHFYIPVVLHSKSNLTIYNFNELSKKYWIELADYKNQSLFNTPDTIPVFNNSVPDEVIIACDKCVLNIDEAHIQQLAHITGRLLGRTSRVNINLKISKESNLIRYEQQLKKIIDILLDFYRRGEVKEVNRLTDRLVLSEMDNCGAGEYTYAVAPNGKIYICPAFYYNDPCSDIGSIDEGIILSKELFQLEKSPYCSECDAFHCNRCVYLNKHYTGEYNIPSAIQCKVSHLERNHSLLLLEKLYAENLNQFSYNNTQLAPIDYNDPIKRVLSKTSINPYNIKNC